MAASIARSAGMINTIQILRESGFLPTGRLGLVDFGRIPRGLNAEAREKFLRERGWEICFPRHTALPPEERPGLAPIESTAENILRVCLVRTARPQEGFEIRK
jgi:hypothetical protein